MPDLKGLLADVADCKICALSLDLGARPVVQIDARAKILIIGQAPGTRVHASGIAWDDASGDRLRNWLQISSDNFYDARKIAMMPMGFCYPGRQKNAGDLPPRRECAPKWHDILRHQMKDITLTILVGSYAQNHYLDTPKSQTMTRSVELWADYIKDGVFPLPHPSWRVQAWIKNNPWFDDQVIPALRHAVKSSLNI
jgi:uracil-DNA glycosylase